MDKINNALGQMPPLQTITGTWYAIQCMPDIATKEVLNIGVGVEIDGKAYVRLLDLFDRVECLYARDMVFHAELACAMTRDSIMSQGFTEDINHHIRCDKRGFTQGESVDQILNRLYDAVVSLGKLRRTE
ncbi:hypothetical protein [Photobacterium leiognathi]|uniref:hypothetical protein n=1 Tax=Photobacterium leiognathi TaxID=553611 RepID=UPI002980D315|nr:hypothetical protein [Photobacterium leiognathi]